MPCVLSHEQPVAVRGAQVLAWRRGENVSQQPRLIGSASAHHSLSPSSLSSNSSGRAQVTFSAVALTKLSVGTCSQVTALSFLLQPMAPALWLLHPSGQSRHIDEWLLPFLFEYFPVLQTSHSLCPLSS